MVSRVTHYRIRPGKVEEFAAIIAPLIAAMDKLPGFRVLLVLRGEGEESRDAMAISVWDSAADLQNSDNDAFYYEVLGTTAELLRKLLADAPAGSPGQQIRE